MREHKFRAWDKNSKKMLYNFLVDSQGETFIIRDPMLPSGDSFGFCDIIPSKDDVELMQYTGLKGKNGKEVYEGDIVRDHYGDWIIRFGEHETSQDYYASRAYGWYCEKVKYNYEPEKCTIVDVYRKCEIVGNVYENLELIANRTK
jgi:uncharacterized phage protein (TIGR01671 family)